MSDTGDSRGSAKNVRNLTDAIRRVRTAEAERSDVVVELRDAERARLEMLADELKGVFAEVPAEDEQFVFAVAPGTPPRLWIDLTSFVIMGRDRRTYRFLKDTRLGRTVIRETPNLDEIADTVTQYVAERIIERERAIEGDWVVKRIMRGDTERRQDAKQAIVAAKEPPAAAGQSRLGGGGLHARHSPRHPRAPRLCLGDGSRRIAGLFPSSFRTPGDVMKIAVVGLGSTGLGVSASLAGAGHDVWGFEQNGPAAACGSSRGDTRIFRLTPGEGEIYVDLAEDALRRWRLLEAQVGASLLQAKVRLHGRTAGIRLRAILRSSLSGARTRLCADRRGRCEPGDRGLGALAARLDDLPASRVRHSRRAGGARRAGEEGRVERCPSRL